MEHNEKHYQIACKYVRARSTTKAQAHRQNLERLVGTKQARVYIGRALDRLYAASRGPGRLSKG